MRLPSVILISLLVACGSDTAPSAKTEVVSTVGDQFVPTLVTIAPGDTVRWDFAGGSDGMGHDVTFGANAAGAPANIPVTKSGSVSRVFTIKGTFTYNCFVHPGMTGEVHVQ